MYFSGFFSERLIFYELFCEGHSALRKYALAAVRGLMSIKRKNSYFSPTGFFFPRYSLVLALGTSTEIVYSSASILHVISSLLVRYASVCMSPPTSFISYNSQSTHHQQILTNHNLWSQSTYSPPPRARISTLMSSFQRK